MKMMGLKRGALACGAAALMVTAALMCGCAGAPEGSSSASADASAASSSSAAAEAAASDMTIHVTMTQDVTSTEAPDTPLQFAEESIDIVAPQGATALEVLQGTDREIKTSGEGDDVEVIAIGGLENGAAGEGSHWSYAVNGQEEKASPAVFTLSDGDAMVWTFVAA